ncbi:hypothetical protein FKM82_025128, partial [Ascaphus truei]
DAIVLHVPDIPVIGLLDQDVALPCSFFPPADFTLQNLSVIWQLTDTQQQVYRFSEGREQLESQGPDFRNRTRLFQSELPWGNISLLLRGVRLSDEGTYTCFVSMGNYSRAAISLQVAAPFSKPTLHLEPSEGLKPGDRVTVTCHTFRGYPEAELLWQDGEGRNLTQNVTTSLVASEEGLYHVQSAISVILETSNTYTCLVHNPVLQEVTHASLTITGQCVCVCDTRVTGQCVCLTHASLTIT